MVNVPAYLVDLLFDVIEDKMCSLVFFAINVLDNVIDKSLDALCVIS